MARAKPARVRRRPEEARAHILDAAEAVFADALPDQVGLREIAERAGISHGLITHYFGTYDQLVEAVIERRLGAAREAAMARLAEMTFAADEIPLVAVLVDLVDDRTLMRLVAWAVLTKRDHAMLGSHGQLGRIVDAIVARAAVRDVRLTRARVELAVIAAITITTGLGVAGDTLAQLFGRDAPVGKAALRAELQRMLRAYLTAP